MRFSAFARNSGIMLAAAAALVPLGAASVTAQQPAAQRHDTPLYRDAKAPVEARVEDLLGRMTLEEKVAQLLAVWQNKPEILDANLQFDAAKMSARYPNGLGQFTRPSDVKGAFSPRVVARHTAEQSVKLANELQHWAIEKTRLGIPLLFHEEGLHGFAAIGATSFPQAIGLASTWDPALMREINAVIAREIRARGVHLVLSPVVDVARDPRWGRIEETFGEDPYLAGEMGVAAVEGLQGSSDNLAPGKVFATLKHLTGHGQPESGTNVGPAQISERVLRENFFPPFEEVVRRTKIGAVMPSYNEIDGVPSHANTWLLTDVLRGEWGFKGAIISDYSAIDDLTNLHKVAASLEDAAVMSLNAGVDSDMPDGLSFASLTKAVREGRVSQARIDDATRKMLTLKFRAGLFEKPFADIAEARAVTNNAEARALALKAAQRSIILLKNDGMLPLAMPKGGAARPTIAVIGPSAAVARLGGYYGEPPVKVSILDGIKAKVGKNADIVFAQGVKITENDDWWADEVKLSDPAENRRLIAEAVEAARNVDQIILTLGDTEQTSREGWAKSHLGDRPSLDLVGEQQELFDALKALGKPITVILINGRPASTVKIAEQANALIEGWYLGEQGGNAVADVLFGDVNPGGKLTLTIPRSVGQLPMFYNAKPSARRGYLFDTVDPLFPFGHGLSYTSFDIGAPQLSQARIAPNGTVRVSVAVRNTGKRTGDETVQLYVRDKISSVTRPLKELKGFERVTLKPGESRTLNFTLDERAFRMWNDKMKRVVEPGEFDIMVGPNSVDLKSVTLTIAG
ncbi:glycoside hydrolase family 3 N-terminal domain-containing protein [Sphingomonas sp. LaA6.9]|uniref:glycoside hydrolase family 3 N-terminal domain-containing protein n=1 Tax=Sphingomonas sp. LaA6.9 TaxID=2919914 RepID=UPI001F4F1D29|nr:glycoside hydrolase family 3 N-terminal domain-containing protein [Sphingomonas sp. LaA6.9]MCJ8157911.1 glycoside hydrolase family 3 C-terminal domain-containing protein [Sphingomonas sp. LaA6.9]